MGGVCASGKSQDKKKKKNNNKHSKAIEQMTESQEMSIIERLEPPEKNIQSYRKTFSQFLMLLEQLGDISHLSKQTREVINHIFDIKKDVERKSLDFEQQPEKKQQQISFYLSQKYFYPLCEMIALLLNSRDFNESFPILRETFKKFYYDMDKHTKEITEFKNIKQSPGLANVTKEFSKGESGKNKGQSPGSQQATAANSPNIEEDDKKKIKK